MEAPIPGASIGSMGCVTAIVEVIVREMLGVRCRLSLCRVQKASPAGTSPG